MPNENTLAASFLVISQGVVLYTVLLPNLQDVRRTHPASNPAMATDVRVGEIIAGLLVVATGIIAAALARNPLPFWLSLIIGTMMTGAFELTFNLDPRKVIG